MTATFLQIPFPVFFDSNGDPLDNGFIYIGRPDENPITDPIEVFFDADLTIPAVQPLRTIRGRIDQGGAPGNIYANLTLPSAYSMTVLNKNKELVFSVPKGTGFDSSLGNIEINNNTISSSNTDGDIILDPNGAGDIVLDADVGIGISDPTIAFQIEKPAGVQGSVETHLALSRETSNFAYLATERDTLDNDVNALIVGVGASGAGEKLRITQTGDVGIGTEASPSFGAGTGMEIQRAGVATLRLDNSTLNHAVELRSDTDIILESVTGSQDLIFRSNGADRITFMASGGATFTQNLTFPSCNIANLMTVSTVLSTNITNSQNISSGTASIGTLTTNTTTGGAGGIEMDYQGTLAAKLEAVSGGGLEIDTGSSSTTRFAMTNDGAVQLRGSTSPVAGQGLSNGLYLYYRTDQGTGIVGATDSALNTDLSFRTKAAGQTDTERLNIDEAGNFTVNSSTATFNEFVDDDTFAGASDQAIASAQSIKAYIDSQIAAGVPPGALWDYAGNTIPTGWLICDGSAVSQTTYANLFAAIGGTYNTGGEPAGTFRVPDLRGRVIAALDNQGSQGSSGRLTSTGAGAGFNTTTLGGAGADQSTILSVLQIPSHNHSVSNLNVPITVGPQTGNGTTIISRGLSNSPSTVNLPGSATIGNTGGDGAHSNVQPTMVMYKIIKT